MFSQEYLNERFEYDADTGRLTWRARANAAPSWNTRYAGKQFGAKRPDGYLRGSLDGQFAYAHRLIWALLFGEWPETIDHINGDRSDNRLANLRAASNAQNLCNRGKQANNSTGFKGVYFSRAADRYVAQIKSDGRMRYLGLFATKELAAEAYARAAEKTHGEFAKAA